MRIFELRKFCVCGDILGETLGLLLASRARNKGDVVSTIVGLMDELLSSEIWYSVLMLKPPLRGINVGFTLDANLMPFVSIVT